LKLTLDGNLGHRARRHLVEAGRIRIYQNPNEDPLDRA
jgi:hypothetical protein